MPGAMQYIAQQMCYGTGTAHISEPQPLIGVGIFKGWLHALAPEFLFQSIRLSAGWEGFLLGVWLFWGARCGV